MEITKENLLKVFNDKYDFIELVPKYEVENKKFFEKSFGSKVEIYNIIINLDRKKLKNRYLGYIDVIGSFASDNRPHIEIGPTYTEKINKLYNEEYEIWDVKRYHSIKQLKKDIDAIIKS